MDMAETQTSFASMELAAASWLHCLITLNHQDGGEQGDQKKSEDDREKEEKEEGEKGRDWSFWHVKILQI